eukprot:Seg16460.3 transcript_id=Seg16460.3/GoldUCD/mRNA.D3Y31 product="hypothetical protein" protein_id=Seg16460.3/GoldUCD/D3Y31
MNKEGASNVPSSVTSLKENMKNSHKLILLAPITLLMSCADGLYQVNPQTDPGISRENAEANRVGRRVTLNVGHVLADQGREAIYDYRLIKVNPATLISPAEAFFQPRIRNARGRVVRIGESLPVETDNGPVNATVESIGYSSVTLFINKKESFSNSGQGNIIGGQTDGESHGSGIQNPPGGEGQIIPRPAALPTAERVQGTTNLVKSPYTGKAVNIEGLTPGQKAFDPTTSSDRSKMKKFIVPN